MITAEIITENRGDGWGYWPGPMGTRALAKGRTMKQMRAWAQARDVRFERIQSEKR